MFKLNWNVFIEFENSGLNRLPFHVEQFLLYGWRNPQPAAGAEAKSSGPALRSEACKAWKPRGGQGCKLSDQSEL